MFSSSELTAYVASANLRFEDYAESIGVVVADIPLALPTSVTDFVLADMYMSIARDNTGSEGNMIGDSNLYASIYAL